MAEQNVSYPRESSFPSVATELLIGNITLQFFNYTDKQLLQSTLRSIGGTEQCLVIFLATNLYLVTGYTDRRKSIDGLCAIVVDHLKKEPRISFLYMVCGKRCDRMKVPL